MQEEIEDLEKKKKSGTGLSADFKDMILKLFSYDGAKRCTVEELKAHPWLNSAGYNKEATQAALLSELHHRQMAAKPAPF